ncbi:hypothetical protein [Bernardetia sp.]|uniref:hypothetical protein n=1 Tax=Bernardetia sp. TaxID=1937974 RepID=UPI0025C24D7A|nr:hypothetical protein [Bernardetia sp.]
MANQNKNYNKEERKLDELEKFLLTHRSKLQKEEQKSIDEEFDASFSMEKNFLAIQQKLKAEKEYRSEAKNSVEAKAKKLLQAEQEETKSWVKPSPVSEKMAKSVQFGSVEVKREVTDWVKPSPINYSSSALKVKEEKENKPAKTVSLRKFRLVAASLVALLVATLGYHFDTVSVLSHENEQLISMYEEGNVGSWEEEHQNNVVQTVALPAELVEAENYYTSVIAKEKQELKKKDTENWVTPETIQTLDELDEAYKIMKSDLLEEQNPKVLIDEMLENLKLRKQILDESIQILEQSNSETHQNNKTNEKSI